MTAKFNTSDKSFAHVGAVQMKQSRRASAIEGGANIAVGFVIQFTAQWFVFRLVTGSWVSFAENLQIGLLMTAVSFVRSYGLRRLFETIRVKGIMP